MLVGPFFCSVPDTLGFLLRRMQRSSSRPRKSYDVVEILEMRKLNVFSKRFREHFSGFRLGVLGICDGFFNADDVMAFGALAEVMTGVIHFYPWSKPSHMGQFWCSHC